jgi:uncharacterized protein YegL
VSTDDTATPTSNRASAVSVAAVAPHLPVWVVVDTSASMTRHADALHAGVTAALDVAWGTLHAMQTTRIGVLTAGESAAVALPLAPPVEPGNLGRFRTGGRSDMSGLIELLGAETERVVRANLAVGRRTLEPWVLLLSDGRWDRSDAVVAVERLHAPPTRPTVCPLGVGDMDEITLARVGRGGGFAVNTPDDLPTAMGELMRAILAQAGSETPAQLPQITSLTGARPLEGW